MATLVPINLSVLSTGLKKKGFQEDLLDTTYYKWEKINSEQKNILIRGGLNVNGYENYTRICIELILEMENVVDCGKLALLAGTNL